MADVGVLSCLPCSGHRPPKTITKIDTLSHERIGKMKVKIASSMLLMGVTSAAMADVFGPGPGGAIPDATGCGATAVATPFTSVINIPNAGTVTSLNSVTVTTQVGHTWVGDLVYTLTAPSGENVHLIARTGSTTAGGVGNGNNLGVGSFVYVNGPTTPTWTAHCAANPVIPPGTFGRETLAGAASPPTPDPDTFAVFAGVSVTGNWTLTITDGCAADTGSIASWSLDMTLGGGSCDGDVDGDGDVDVDDLIAVILGWGCTGTCAADVDGDGDVDVDDLIGVIINWGPC
jgi:subtilisin-like proprotein convertase family protein